MNASTPPRFAAREIGAKLAKYTRIRAADWRGGFRAACQDQNGHLDREPTGRFNLRVYLYALVAADSSFAVDVFTSRERAQQALAEVLADEPAFEPLLEIIPIPPPWLDERDHALAGDPR